MILTKEQILQSSDIKTETVFVSEWGGDVKVKTLTAAEHSQLIADGEGEANNTFMPRLVSACVVDEDNNRLFTAADLDALKEKSLAAILSIFKVARDINGLGDDEQEKAEKNS